MIGLSFCSLQTHRTPRHEFVHCGEFNNIMHPARARVMGPLGLEGFQSVPVHHCRDAWGLVLRSTDGWKVVYS
eukprot:scaffold100664_cov30-Prasinocladus_malaysianus.AAC.1